MHTHGENEKKENCQPGCDFFSQKKARAKQARAQGTEQEVASVKEGETATAAS